MPGPGSAVSRGLLALGLSFLVAHLVLAQDPPPPEPAPSVASPPKMDVSGFVDVYYLYDFNKVDPQLRTFDVQHNAFS